MFKHPAGTKVIATPLIISMYGVQSALCVTGSNPREGLVPVGLGMVVAVCVGVGEIEVAVVVGGMGVVVMVGVVGGEATSPLLQLVNKNKTIRVVIKTFIRSSDYIRAVLD